MKPGAYIEVPAVAEGELKCDCCGQPTPASTRDILYGLERWAEFVINGEYDGRKYEGRVLLCGNRVNGAGCARAMEAYIARRGTAMFVQTFRGGQDAEPRWADEHDEPQPVIVS